MTRKIKITKFCRNYVSLAHKFGFVKSNNIKPFVQTTCKSPKLELVMLAKLLLTLRLAKSSNSKGVCFLLKHKKLCKFTSIY